MPRCPAQCPSARLVRPNAASFKNAKLGVVEWKKIPGFSNYLISNTGVIKSLYRSKRHGNEECFLKYRKDKDGYLMVGLWDDFLKKQVQQSVSRLVLLTFIGSCPLGMQCCHFDGNVENNKIENLRWDTSKGNHEDAVRAGTHTGFTKKGENNPFVKLTEQQVVYIRKTGRLGRNYAWLRKSLANECHVTHRTVSDILTRRIWRHI